MQKISPTSRTSIDLYEFLRFILTGLTATVGNMATVYASGYLVEYRLALIAGLFVGFLISFVMGKLFAFKSPSANATRQEFSRFILVYAFGATLYWFVASFVGLYVASRFLPQRFAELVGVFAGASLMVVTSYFGHRLFTFAGAKNH